MTRIFHTSQTVNAPVAEIIRFFHDVNNLPLLAPPFPTVSLSGPAGVIQAGGVFHLRVAAGPVAMRWTGSIDEIRNDGSFVDTLEGGPFRSWRHTHAFEADGEGTRVRDSIAMTPAWWFSPFAGIVVRGLFLYRRRALRRVFP
jgi:ligand-binding SRPBCC domain-containing protein